MDTSREKAFGKRFEDIAPTDDERAAGLHELAAALDDAVRLIAAQNGADAFFFGGDRPIFADTALAAMIMNVHGLFGGEHEITKLIFSVNDGRWAKYHDAFTKWSTIV